MIFTENYYIDNTGKQIYEPAFSTVTPVVLYADDPYANAAFEKMRLNLTLEEIYNLSVYGEVKVDIIEKNATYLSPAEIAALYEMSYEELYAAYIALVYAAETYGAADYNPEAETTTVTEAAPETTTTTAETTTTPPVTTVGDKTDISYDKTEIVTSMGDKTDAAVTTMGDKTDISTTIGNILTTMGDKTDIFTSSVGGSYPEKTEIVTSYFDKTEPVVTETSPETTTISSTTTTLPPETTLTTTSGRFDVQGTEDTAATTTDPKG